MNEARKYVFSGELNVQIFFPKVVLSLFGGQIGLQLSWGMRFSEGFTSRLLVAFIVQLTSMYLI
jgi:hypothetical protein